MAASRRTRHSAGRADQALFELLQRRQDRRAAGADEPVAPAVHLELVAGARARLDAAAATSDPGAIREAAIWEAIAALDLARDLPEPTS